MDQCDRVEAKRRGVAGSCVCVGLVKSLLFARNVAGNGPISEGARLEDS